MSWRSPLVEYDGPGPCQKCGADGGEDHACPFLSDMIGDSTTLCNCCVECYNRCVDDT